MANFHNEIETLKNLVRRGLILRFGKEDNKTRLESDAEHIFSAQNLLLK